MAQFNDNDGLNIQTSMHGWTRRISGSYTVTRKDRLIRVDNSGGGGVVSFGLGHDGQEVTLLLTEGGGGGFVTAPVSGSYTISAQALTNAGHWITYVYDATNATWWIKGGDNT